MKEIKHIEIGHSAKVMAFLAIILSALFIVPTTLFFVFGSGPSPRWDFLQLLLVPLAYGLGSYLMWLLIFLTYNWVSKCIGGIRIQVDE